MVRPQLVASFATSGTRNDPLEESYNLKRFHRSRFVEGRQVSSKIKLPVRIGSARSSVDINYFSASECAVAVDRDDATQKCQPDTRQAPLFREKLLLRVSPLYASPSSRPRPTSRIATRKFCRFCSARSDRNRF